MAGNNQEDPRLVAVEEGRKEALARNAADYDALIRQTEEQYQTLIQGAQDYADEQSRLQEEKTENAVEEIRQQQTQTRQDYLQEQSAAYTDYQKQTNAYAPQAEALADSGLSGSGYSESARVGMYNAYQNRVAVAREGFERAVQEYNTAMGEARQLNSAALAKIAYETLQTRTELALKAIDRRSKLEKERQEREWELSEQFDARYQALWEQIRQEQEGDSL